MMKFLSIQTKSKKILAIFLSLAVVFSAIIVTNIPTNAVESNSVDSQNLIQNGDFENTTPGDFAGKDGNTTDSSSDKYINAYKDTTLNKWYLLRYDDDKTASSLYYTVDKYNGVGSMSLVSSATDNTKPFFYNFSTEKNTNYRISFWYKVPNVASSNLEVRGEITTTDNSNPDTAASEILGFSAVSKSGSSNYDWLATAAVTKWTQYSGSFNSGDHEILRLLFRIKGSGTTLLIDDIVIEKVDNLILNGDFEDTNPGDFAGKDGNTTDSSSDKYINAYKDTTLNKWFLTRKDPSLGESGMHVVDSTDVNTTGVMKLDSTGTKTLPFFYNFSTEMNTRYRISFRYKVSAYASSSAEVAAAITTTNISIPDDYSDDTIKHLGYGITESNKYKLETSATTDWKTYYGTFDSGSNTILRLLFRINGNRTTLLVDDIVIEKLDNLIINGDFEDANPPEFLGKNGIYTGESDLHVNTYKGGTKDSWYQIMDEGSADNSMYASDAKDYQNTTHYMQMHNKSGSSPSTRPFFYDFDTEKNTNYRISFCYKVIGSVNGLEAHGAVATTAGTGYANDAVLLGFANGSYTMSKAATDGWVYYSGTFNSGENTVLRLIYRVKGEDVKLLVDDIVIEKQELDPEGVITNGGFEDGARKWTLGNGHSISADVKNNGTKSLKVTGGNYSYTEKTFTVAKNTDYKLTYYANGTRGVKVDFNNITSYAKKWAELGDGNEWVENTVIFNSGENTEIKLQFKAGEAEDTSAATYIDDVALVKKLIGDINSDSSINAEDLVILRRALLYDEPYKTVNDVNLNDKVDICDLVRLKKLESQTV